MHSTTPQRVSPKAIREAASLGIFDWEPGAVSERLGEVTSVGLGQTYEAWKLTLHDADPVALRVVHRPIETLPRPMRHEFAALRLVPEGIGPRGLLMDDTSDNPLGRPWILATFAPGAEKPVAEWTDDDLTNNARQLARLHEPSVVVRGSPDSPGLWSLDIEEQFSTGWQWWHDHHPEITAQERFRAARRAVEPFLKRRARDFDRLDTYALIHGDLVATNVVFDDAGTPRYIDWEWSEYEDVAKDLALIGGRVHGGPWYVPMTQAQVESLVRTYATEREKTTGTRPDEAALLRRRDAWEAHERLQTAMHNAMKAADPGTPDPGMYATAVDSVLTTLNQRLDDD